MAQEGSFAEIVRERETGWGAVGGRRRVKVSKRDRNSWHTVL